VIQRDRHAYYLQRLAVIASTLDKIATEIRHLQRNRGSAKAEEFFQREYVLKSQLAQLEPATISAGQSAVCSLRNAASFLDLRRPGKIPRLREPRCVAVAGFPSRSYPAWRR